MEEKEIKSLISGKNLEELIHLSDEQILGIVNYTTKIKSTAKFKEIFETNISYNNCRDELKKRGYVQRWFKPTEQVKEEPKTEITEDKTSITKTLAPYKKPVDGFKKQTLFLDPNLVERINNLHSDKYEYMNKPYLYNSLISEALKIFE